MQGQGSIAFFDGEQSNSADPNAVWSEWSDKQCHFKCKESGRSAIRYRSCTNPDPRTQGCEGSGIKCETACPDNTPKPGHTDPNIAFPTKAVGYSLEKPGHTQGKPNTQGKPKPGHTQGKPKPGHIDPTVGFPIVQ